MHEVKLMEKEALEAAAAFLKVMYNDPIIGAALDEGYAQGGYSEEMKRAAEALIARLHEAYSMPSDIATFYAMAGEKDKTIEWLEKGCEVRDPPLTYLSGLSCFNIVRGDLRFQDLLRKMRLPASDVKSQGA